MRKRRQKPIKLINYITLSPNEYLILAGTNSDAKNYEVFYKGERINDVTGLIRVNI